MKVKRNTLLLLACLVWSAAGFNILRIGLTAYPAYLSVLNFLLSVLVFAVFQRFIFGKLVKKHTSRIVSYLEERHFFLKFLCHYGGNDDWWNWPAGKWTCAGAVYCRVLHRPGSCPAAGRIAVWPKLWQSGLCCKSKHGRKRSISDAGNYGNSV